MQAKFVKTANLGELESTANMLFVEGWDRDSPLQICPDGEYLMTFVKRIRRGEDSPPGVRPATGCAGVSTAGA